eukprot:scaffold56961_cov26-Tisochrysis_lutea.AAC.7
MSSRAASHAAPPSPPPLPTLRVTFATLRAIRRSKPWARFAERPRAPRLSLASWKATIGTVNKTDIRSARAPTPCIPPVAVSKPSDADSISSCTSCRLGSDAYMAVRISSASSSHRVHKYETSTAVRSITSTGTSSRSFRGRLRREQYTTAAAWRSALTLLEQDTSSASPTVDVQQSFDSPPDNIVGTGSV